MTKLSVGFGYNSGVPAEARAVWGARLIVSQDGYTDFLADRTDRAGEQAEVEALFDLLEERYPLGQLRKDLSAGLQAYKIRTRERDEITLYADDQLLVIGNTNASAGYFYVSAVLRDSTPIGETA